MWGRLRPAPRGAPERSQGRTYAAAGFASLWRYCLFVLGVRDHNRLKSRVQSVARNPLLFNKLYRYEERTRLRLSEIYPALHRSRGLSLRPMIFCTVRSRWPARSCPGRAAASRHAVHIYLGLTLLDFKGPSTWNGGRPRLSRPKRRFNNVGRPDHVQKTLDCRTRSSHGRLCAHTGRAANSIRATKDDGAIR